MWQGLALALGGKLPEWLSSGDRRKRGALQLDFIADTIEKWKEDPDNPGVIAISTGMRDLLATWLRTTATTMDPKGKRHKNQPRVPPE